MSRRLREWPSREMHFLDTSWNAVLPLHRYVPILIACLRAVCETLSGEE